MKIWKVMGYFLDDLYICSEDSREALKKARLINDDYTATQMYSEIEH